MRWFKEIIKINIFYSLMLIIPAAVLSIEYIPPFIRLLLFPSVLFLFTFVLIQNYIKRYDLSFQGIGLTTEGKLLRLFTIGIFGSIISVGIMNLIFTILPAGMREEIRLIPPFEWMKLLMSHQASHKISGTLLTSFVFLLLAMSEELFYRGFILNYINKYTNRLNAVLLSSILFSLAHIHPYIIGFTFIPGLLMGIVFIYTKNLITPTILHYFYNLLVFYSIGFID